jgi:hypothetical protein
MQSALPIWLRMWWAMSAPLGLLLAGRVAWEKTVWTWTRGPQMVGWSLLHIHPGFAVLGFLCCLSLMAWLIPFTVYAIAHRKAMRATDVVMLACSLLVVVAIITPDTFFAK